MMVNWSLCTCCFKILIHIQPWTAQPPEENSFPPLTTASGGYVSQASCIVSNRLLEPYYCFRIPLRLLSRCHRQTAKTINCSILSTQILRLQKPRPISLIYLLGVQRDHWLSAIATCVDLAGGEEKTERYAAP